MSGNGMFANVTKHLMGPPLPHWKGGGCIYNGPFVNFTANLGPVNGIYPEVKENPIPGGRGYNPRCLRRDISKFTSMHSTSDANVTDLITQNNDYTSFQTAFEDVSSKTVSLGIGGVHFGGHYTYGGDPGGDFFASSGDPMFFLHHASVDRTWWIWQNLKPEKRTYETGMTTAMFNFPPSRNGTLDDSVDLGILGKDLQIRETVSSVKGPFCYIYV
jgi:tyrosinase